MDKPEPVKTHLRDMVVVPEMIGSVVGVYNGKVFNGIEVKPEMVGHYLGEFSITHSPCATGDRASARRTLALYPPEVRAKPYGHLAPSLVPRVRPYCIPCPPSSAARRI